nr:MAG TPA: hypothetical protein [Caudoviricetes sp.]
MAQLLNKQTLSDRWCFKISLIAGNSRRLSNYNIISNNKCECLKIDNYVTIRSQVS